MPLRRSLFILLLSCAFIATAYLQAGGLEPRSTAPAATALSRFAESQTTAESQRAVLQRYCLGCHSEQVRSGGLSLEAVDLADVASAGETWEKVVRKVNAGMMPPPGMPRPDAVTQRGLLCRGSRTSSTVPRWPILIQVEPRHFIDSTAPSTRTRSVIFWPSTSPWTSCSRPTTRATGSTTTRAC